MSEKSFKNLFANARKRDSFWVEGAILDFTAELETVMNQKQMSKTELASILGTSKSYITKVFRGNANFTIESMVKLTRAIGAKLHIHVADERAGVRWLDVHDGYRKAIVIDAPNDEMANHTTCFNHTPGNALTMNYKSSKSYTTAIPELTDDQEQNNATVSS